jgi:hypothetical protein
VSSLGSCTLRLCGHVISLVAVTFACCECSRPSASAVPARQVRYPQPAIDLLCGEAHHGHRCWLESALLQRDTCTHTRTRRHAYTHNTYRYVCTTCAHKAPRHLNTCPPILPPNPRASPTSSSRVIPHATSASKKRKVACIVTHTFIHTQAADPQARHEQVEPRNACERWSLRGNEHARPRLDRPSTSHCHHHEKTTQTAPQPDLSLQHYHLHQHQHQQPAQVIECPPAQAPALSSSAAAAAPAADTDIAAAAVAAAAQQQQQQRQQQQRRRR